MVLGAPEAGGGANGKNLVQMLYFLFQFQGFYFNCFSLALAAEVWDVS